ncbi:hypothetical protein D4T97_016575 [Siminovitchia acidinfaciens]|uniref:Uncharacterized protein n=1 Tax=Siminovitchia acidinfaciens TaxID=2321395 RepID=A0A429XVF8_9BACI|nr:hypothetical protein [Siminovitchia acidinfaciens]RST72256.1 hypothetical protein D4T97_016575 [Siminovitchia acidinfaciens]
MPDLYFYKWCDLKYGINRGIYNTIDALLYEKGYTDVYERRFILTRFLAHSLKQDLYDEKANAIKFGRGNLTIKVTEFVDSHA